MLRFDPVSESEGTSPEESANHRPLFGNDAAGEKPAMPSFKRGLTIIPGMIRHQLTVAGISLPRPDAIRGIESWCIWFDNFGKPVDQPFPDSASESMHTAFSASAKNNRLCYRMSGEESFSQVDSLPFSIADANGNTYAVSPSPLNEMQLGILSLPDPPVYPIDENPFLIGRSVSERDIRLDLLSHPQGLTWQPGTGNSGNTLGDIGLSGEHARLRLTDDQLAVKMTGGRLAIHILDGNGSLKTTLHPFQDQEIRMAAGEYLMVGCYLLGFDT